MNRWMISAFTTTAAVLVLACQPAGEPEATEGGDEAQMTASPEAGIEAMVDAFEEAWAAGDAAAIATHFTADADLSGPDGELVEGSGAIEARYAELLAGVYQGSTIEIEIDSIRWLDEDTALINGTWSNAGMPEGSEVPAEGIYTDIVVKSGDAWKITSLRAWYPIAAPGTS